MPVAVCVAFWFPPGVGEAAAQEVIELPLEDRFLDSDFPEVYRIGNGNREWELFTRLTTLGFDGRGHLHIADLVGDELRVVVVDSAGGLVAEFGGLGEGPGEFRDASEAFALADGRTVVPDQGHFAYHIFGSNGEFERMVRFPGVGSAHDRPAALTPSAQPRLRRNDYAGALLSRVTHEWQMRMDSAARTFSWKIGDGPRRVARVTFEGEEAKEDLVAEASNVDENVKFGFGSLPDGRIAFSDSAAYAIKIARPGTGVSRILARPFPARPWNDRSRRAYGDHLVSSVREATASGGEGAEIAGFWGGLDGLESGVDVTSLRGEIALVDWLETTWNGNIWVLRTPPDGFPAFDLVDYLAASMGAPAGSPPTRPGAIDVITPEGRYVGTLARARMPAAFGPGGLVAYVDLDEFDVPSVAVRRVPEDIRQ